MHIETHGETKRITIDPVGRTEGHLGITVSITRNKVTEAKAFSPVYRGFEKIMVGRDPREAIAIPMRICGVCPMVHAVCGSKNVEMAFGMTYNDNARLMRNISQATHLIGDHLLHFYHLASLDFIRGPDKAPFLPRYEGDYRIPQKETDELIGHYVEALQVRRISQEAAAIFTGKLPHAMSFVPGGVSEAPTKEKLEEWRKRMERVVGFVQNVWRRDIETVAKYYPDYAKIGIGSHDYLSMGVFEQNSKDTEHFYRRGVVLNGKLEALDIAEIKEDVTYTWQDGANKRSPRQPDTKTANPDKEKAYSFITAPRYRNRAMEVGPFSRLKVSGHMDGDASVLTRHVARLTESVQLADALKGWAGQLQLGQSGMVNAHEPPKEAQSYGMSEATRGACSHWMKIENGKIAQWQAIPATNWNASPMDAEGHQGPLELALLGTEVADFNNPIEVVRVVRSFDPCMACSVHVITPEEKLGPFVVTAGF